MLSALPFLVSLAHADQSLSRVKFGAKVEQNSSVSKILNWSVICNSPTSQCRLSQRAVDKNRTPRLEFSITRLPKPQNIDGVDHLALVEIYTPIAVVLKDGINLILEGEKLLHSQFLTCEEYGCIVRQPVTAQTIDQLKAGSRLQLVFRSVDHGKINTWLSLMGFTRAYNKI